MDRTDISVCIANFNGKEIIEDCIESVLAQTGHFRLEIIIHDDCSNDNSLELIKTNYPNINLIESIENVGYCISNNRMVDQANGKYILLLNNDATLQPGALAHLYEHAEIDTSIGIATLPQYSKENGEALDKGMMLDIFANPIPNLEEGLKEVATVMGACLWVRKKLWVEIGGFPPWFESIAEDMYLCCYARILGYKVLALPQKGYEHWVGHSFGGGRVKNNKLTTTVDRRRLSERNKTFVMHLFWPSYWAAIIIPIHLTMLLAEGLTISIIKTDRNIFFSIYWTTILSYFKNFNLLTIKRRKIQARRVVSSKILFSTISLIPHKLRLLVKYGLPTIRN